MRRLLLLTIFLTTVSLIVPAIHKPAFSSDEYTEVTLKQGNIFRICKSGLVVCPVRMPICDDPEMVEFVDTPDGLGIKAKAKGETLCSVQSNVGQRLIFKLIVE